MSGQLQTILNLSPAERLFRFLEYLNDAVADLFVLLHGVVLFACPVGAVWLGALGVEPRAENIYALMLTG